MYKSIAVAYDELTKEKYSTGDVGRLIHKDYRTIALYREKGLLYMEQDPMSGRWYSSKEDVIRFLKDNGLLIENVQTRKTICYARVSSHDQKKNGDLDRQSMRLMQAAGCPAEVIQDTGSGLNAKRKGLSKLIDMVIAGDVETVYITHKDRLTRFGYEYLERFFKAFKTEIIVTEDKPDQTAQEELVEDMMSLLASFSGKLYGMRSSKRKEVAEKAASIIEKE